MKKQGFLGGFLFEDVVWGVFLLLFFFSGLGVLLSLFHCCGVFWFWSVGLVLLIFL